MENKKHSEYIADFAIIVVVLFMATIVWGNVREFMTQILIIIEAAVFVSAVFLSIIYKNLGQ